MHAWLMLFLAPGSVDSGYLHCCFFKGMIVVQATMISYILELYAVCVLRKKVKRIRNLYSLSMHMSSQECPVSYYLVQM